VTPGDHEVDFSRLSPEAPALDTPLSTEAFSDKGIQLSGIGTGANTVCTSTALRDTPPFRVHLTSADPDPAVACDGVPVQIRFTTPVTAVAVWYAGTGQNYILEVHFVDGTQNERGTSLEDGSFQAIGPQPGRLIRDVVLRGESPEGQPPIVIQRVEFTVPPP